MNIFDSESFYGQCYISVLSEIFLIENYQLVQIFLGFNDKIIATKYDLFLF